MNQANGWLGLHRSPALASSAHLRPEVAGGRLLARHVRMVAPFQGHHTALRNGRTEAGQVKLCLITRRFVRSSRMLFLKLRQGFARALPIPPGMLQIRVHEPPHHRSRIAPARCEYLRGSFNVQRGCRICRSTRNAELERQTTRDPTEGVNWRQGQREATAADMTASGRGAAYSVGRSRTTLECRCLIGP